MALMSGLVAALSGAPDIGVKSANASLAFASGAPAYAGLPFLGALPTAAGLAVSQGTAMQVSAVRRAVTIRARDLARCRPRLLKTVGKEKQEVAAADHPLAQLFRRPNPWQSWFEFAEQMHVGLLLRGNAYAVKLRDWRGAAIMMIPVNPDLVQMLEAADGSLFYSVSRAGLWLAAVLQNEPVAIPGEDVFHLRDFSFNTLLGVASIALGRDAIGLAMSQEQQAGRWAGNGARPSGVLQSDKPLTKETADRLRSQWDSSHAGVANTGKTVILEDGLKFQETQLTAQDLEFIAARQFSVREIARMYDVPMHKLMEADSQTRATIAELNADYVQSTVMGDCTRWEHRFDHDFGLVDAGLECNFDERELLRADIATQRNVARLGVLSGLITPNEGRNEIGYQPKTDDGGADKLQSPTNLAPHGSAADGVAPDNAGRPAAGAPAKV